MDFWQKQLNQLSQSEWEKLCDNCGKCCLYKIEDTDTGEIHYTYVACKLLNCRTCKCENYPERKKLVENCLDIREMEPEKYRLLPKTCAYRLRSENQPLPSWHPLISGNSESVHLESISIRDRCAKETPELLSDLPALIIEDIIA